MGGTRILTKYGPLAIRLTNLLVVIYTVCCYYHQWGYAIPGVCLSVCLLETLRKKLLNGSSWKFYYRCIRGQGYRVGLRLGKGKGKVNRETALQGGLVMAKSGRLELEDNIYGHYRSIFNHSGVSEEQINRIRWKRKIRAITLFKVIQGHRSRYQSKARMWLPISD